MPLPSGTTQKDPDSVQWSGVQRAAWLDGPVRFPGCCHAVKTEDFKNEAVNIPLNEKASAENGNIKWKRPIEWHERSRMMIALIVLQTDAPSQNLHILNQAYLFSIKFKRNKTEMLKLVTVCLAVGCSMAALSIDLSQNNKYANQSIVSTPCNKDTQIDFRFSSDSKITCTGGSCSTSGLSASTMKFMDINGNDLTLTLVEALVATSADFSVSSLPVVPNGYVVFRFDTDNPARVVIIALPLTYKTSNNGAVVNIDYLTGGTFSKFITNSQTSTLDLTAFKFLNEPDYSKFYHVTNSGKTVTVLISATVLYVQGLAVGQPLAATNFGAIFSPDYAASGDKLCYGSNQVQGLFQTHLRESWPLWAWMISIMLYWLYYFLADSETHECYDKKFENNKMTCWGFYSLHHLGNPEYFSRLSRVSLLYFVFSFQAMVLAALYSTLGDNKAPYTNYEMIIWTAAIAFGASLPLPYLLGGIFLRGIYNTTLQKFRVIKKSRGIMINKSEQAEVFEHEVDNLEERLYSYYFFYYIIIFAGVVCFWVPSIYMMMQVYRDWYYLHRIWLASLAIAFVLDNLIFDPILSAVLGNTGFYRLRGYFYEFVLGQEYKQIQE